MRQRISYEIRTIDHAGDTIDPFFFDGRGAKAKALRVFADYELDGDERAIVLERVTNYISGDDAGSEELEDRDYLVIAVSGDAESLAAGGWQVGLKS
jgi:hypothetical protein